MATEPKTPTESAVKWLAGQSFNNILLIAILTAIGWGSHYGLTIAVPAHLRMIQSGYETLDKSHQTERGEMRLMYDKWFDRIVSRPRVPVGEPSDSIIVNE